MHTIMGVASFPSSPPAQMNKAMKCWAESENEAIVGVIL